MDIKKFADLKKLQRVQDLFSESTGLAAIAVDAEGNYITNGSNFTDFCMKYTRGCEEGLRRCVKCDTECTGTYFCHAGLMDFAADITVDGEKVGAIIGGQVLPAPPDEEKFRAIARELGINEDAYINALRKIPIRSEKMIRASADLLAEVINQMVRLEYIKFIDSARMKAFNDEVGKIISSTDTVRSCIDDLNNAATMQSILAINASIEAAHAGEAGVGFAVVAHEISSNSNKSAEVYSTIEKNIMQISNSVEQIRKSEK